MSPPDTSLLRPQDLVALLDAANQLNSFETLDRTLHQILSVAARLTAVQAGSVILHDEARNDLYFAAATGPVADKLRTVRIPVGKDKSKAGEVFETRRPIVEDHVRGQYQRVDETTQFTTRSMVCAPLVHGDRCFGVIQLINKAAGEQPFTEADLELVSRFATQAAVAIRNALIFEQMISSSGLFALPAVRNELVPQLLSTESTPARERLTVLIADMRAFTRLATAIGRPERLQRTLGDYLGMLSEVVLKHQGIVNKFLGDGVLAVFRGDAGAGNAVAAAFDILDGFDRLKEAWQEVFNFHLGFLDVGVGIATDDEILLGRIGDHRFCELTVVGVGVNLAAALQDQARNGKRVRCDHQTLRRLTDRSAVIVEGPENLTPRSGETPAGMTFPMYHLRRPPRPAVGGDQFDVFVSYRRLGGDIFAHALRAGLEPAYRVFLDVEKLRAGTFDTALLRTIETTPNFLVILSPGAFDRCKQPDDWLRQEIRHALQTRRTIIPVALEGFTFPPAADLPEDIRDIVRYDAVEYSHRYFDAMLSKIRERLPPPASPAAAPGR